MTPPTNPRDLSGTPPSPAGEGNSRDSQGAAAPSFRRPDRPAPAAGEPRPLYGANGGANGGADGGIDGAAGAEIPEGTAMAPFGQVPARAIAEPLAALAAAFQANAEALRRSQEMQAQLGQALQRADRSEALLQSTGALNETFRGLTQVQRSLAQRIDSSERESSQGRWFLPVIVLASLAVVGLGLWLVLRYVNQWREDALGTVDVGTQLASQYQQGVEQGKKEAQAALEAERKASEDRVRRLEDDVRRLEGERDAARVAQRDAQASQQALEAEVSATRVDVLKAKAIEDEANRLRAEAAVRDPEIDRARRELAEERKTTASLRQRLADVGLGRTPTPDNPAPEPPPDPASVAAAAAAPDPTLSRDRHQIDLVRQKLNDLLQAGAATRPDYLQAIKIGGLGAQRMTDVVFGRYAPGGRLLNSIRAKDARILMDRIRRTVEIAFAEGGLEYSGNTVPFPGGTFSAVVAEGDAVSGWKDSGPTLVTTK